MLKGNIIYLSVGSNLGDRLQNLRNATELLHDKVGKLDRASKIYESEAWGYTSANAFYNCCIGLTTRMEPISLLEKILTVEKLMGRIRRGSEYTDRLIDIDMLLFGSISLDHPRLTIPHPSMGKRRFVLEPLAEIAEKVVHPVSGLTIKEMLDQCQDKGAVTVVTTW